MVLIFLKYEFLYKDPGHVAGSAEACVPWEVGKEPSRAKSIYHFPIFKPARVIFQPLK